MRLHRVYFSSIYALSIYVSIWLPLKIIETHYCDIIMGTMASRLICLMVVYSTVRSGADQGKHQSSASLAFVQGIHCWPVNSPHKWPVTRKIFPLDDVIMRFLWLNCYCILAETLHWVITFAVSKFALLSVPRTSVTSRLMDLCNSSLVFILKSKYFLTWQEKKFIHPFLMRIGKYGNMHWTFVCIQIFP